MNRRELLFAGSALLGCACATLPERAERLPGASPEPAHDRRCDHDLCRFWRAAPGLTVEPPVQGEPRLGRCSIGLPEEL